MTGTSDAHREAASRHEAAAKSHERAAKFWEDCGDSDRGRLQHELAEYERGGATLERRWAALVEHEQIDTPSQASERLLREIRQGARQLAANLIRTADALEKSAQLAEQHAGRREQAQGTDMGADERRAAELSHDAAQRARSQAEEWLNVTEVRP
jgi:hypothetical protein